MMLFPRLRFLDLTICTTGACSSMVSSVVSLVKLFINDYTFPDLRRDEGEKQFN